MLWAAERWLCRSRGDAAVLQGPDRGIWTIEVARGNWVHDQGNRRDLFKGLLRNVNLTFHD